uniref:Uncharacterized protein n=1 Tax=Parastrongyloides trichosuri TaxID=131310 RepID=A0A0N4Z996_PARTI
MKVLLRHLLIKILVILLSIQYAKGQLGPTERFWRRQAIRNRRRLNRMMRNQYRNPYGGMGRGFMGPYGGMNPYGGMGYGFGRPYGFMGPGIGTPFGGMGPGFIG